MSKLRFENSKKEKSTVNKGYYVALAVCVMAFGFVGFRSLSDNKDVIGQEKPSGGTTVVQPTTTPTTTEDWDAIAKEVDAALGTENVAEAAAPTAVPTTPTPTQPTTVNKPEKVTYTLPVKGTLHKSFSATELVFSETMQDWRVHNGIDITAAKGDKVKTAAAGEVLDIVDDSMLGTTVIIRHNDGLMAYYCGLSSKPLVKKGQIIDNGTVLGVIDTIVEEIADPPHLHLAVKKDGEWIDPVEAMDLKFS